MSRPFSAPCYTRRNTSYPTRIELANTKEDRILHLALSQLSKLQIKNSQFSVCDYPQTNKYGSKSSRPGTARPSTARPSSARSEMFLKPSLKNSMSDPTIIPSKKNFSVRFQLHESAHKSLDAINMNRYSNKELKWEKERLNRIKLMKRLQRPSVNSEAVDDLAISEIEKKSDSLNEYIHSTGCVDRNIQSPQISITRQRFFSINSEQSRISSIQNRQDNHSILMLPTLF